jgi:hypothetical protein
LRDKANRKHGSDLDRRRADLSNVRRCRYGNRAMIVAILPRLQPIRYAEGNV